MTSDRVVSNVTCLGCGCACDDIHVVTRGNRIVEARNACSLGAAWFGDGVVPQRSTVGGRDVAVDVAIAAAAELLRHAVRPLIYLAPDISWQAQREAVALADSIGASLDSVSSAGAIESILASQERGRASATLGETRNRADLLVFWGVDPSLRYPRYLTRFAATAPPGDRAGGSRSRTLIAVDVDNARGPDGVDRRLSIAGSDEVAILAATAAIVGGGVPAIASRFSRTVWSVAQELARALTSARYVALVADGERGATAGASDPARASALIALAQSLNGPTRGALNILRGGGNRSGADAVLTWQTGYPLAVDFAHGYPRYRPRDGSARPRLARGDVDAVAVIGSVSLMEPELVTLMSARRGVALGPRASESSFAARAVTIDTGVAGIHDGGTAMRMDDVPLPLRPSIAGPRSAAEVTRALREAIAR